MPLLFIDYTKLVLKAYEEKSETNMLPQLLVHPTTANIKQECLNVYNERLNKGEEEENTLRAFFGVPPSGRNFGYVIERLNPDKFRPLQSIIKGEVKHPAQVNVELLAWLIDFIPRPLGQAQRALGTSSGIINPSEANTKKGLEQNQKKLDLENVEDKILDSSNKSQTNLKKDNKPITPEISFNASETPNANIKNNTLKIIAVTGLILTILFGAMYSFQQYQGAGQTAYGNTNSGCMYWAYDHYEQVPCNEDRKGRLFLPLEKEKIKSFRMITRKDTITEWSIEKIYYIKDNNKIKYYTEPGNFPEDISRTLKKLSPYIFAKDSINRKNPE